MQTTCSSCNFPIADNFYYCPNCGKKLKEPPMTMAKQIGIYALSIFLPPLGLWPGIRYVLQKDEKTRMVGIIAIILTIISFAITIWVFIGIVGSFNQNLNSQLNLIQ